MKLQIISLSLLICSSSFAQMASQKDRILNTYQATDKLYDIDCYIFKPTRNIQITATNKTLYSKNKLERDFTAKNKGQALPFNVSIQPHDEKEAEYFVDFGEMGFQRGVIDSNFKKGFYLDPNLTNSSLKLFELNKLYCKINFAESSKMNINNSTGKYHINVHPHSNYDLYDETIISTQNMHDNLDYKSTLLLEEEIDGKGNLVDLSAFLSTGIIPKLPLLVYTTKINIPKTTNLIVSAAGHNRYEFNSSLETVEINYTGGNHNYCIWNNTRKLLTGLLRSESNTQLVINYHTNAIVAQKSGIISGLSFKRSAMKGTRLLRKIFDNDLKTANNYINNYFNYFTTSFITRNGFDGHYKTMTIQTLSKLPFVNKKLVLKGRGERHLKIFLNYL